jgi:muconolactone delta-isomerase
MEFLVEFQLKLPEGTPESEVRQRVSAEADASAELAREGHLVRLWRPPIKLGERKAVGLYRADSEARLDGFLGALPLSAWMRTTELRSSPTPTTPNSRRSQPPSHTRSPPRA